MRKNTIEPTEENLQTWRQDYGLPSMIIKVKHHQARAQLQCYLEDGYDIHRALELVTISYRLTADDLNVIRNMSMSFVSAIINQ